MPSSAPSSDSALRSPKLPDDGATPLVVGVTGHRDVRSADLAELEAEVDRFLASLQELAPTSSVAVMCGMAEGADTLVARCALARQMRVEAVLPMPLELYEDDFTDSGRAELLELLDHPGVDRIELDVPSALSRESVRVQGPERDRLYENLADQILSSSNILLALWDGELTGLAGGTSDVVVRYLRAVNGTHEPTGSAASFESGSGPVVALDPRYAYWIPTRRDRGGSGSAAGSASAYLVGGEGEIVSYGDEMPRELADQLAELNEYNDLYSELERQGKISASPSLLADAPVDANDPYRPALERIDREYTKADALAVHFQNRSDLLFNVTAIVAGTMGVVFLLFAKIATFTGFLIFYLALFGFGLLAFRVARRSQWLSRHLTYRSLAETMRTRFFLVVADAHRGVDVHELMTTTGTHRLPGFALIDGLVRATEPPAPEHHEQRQAAAMVDWVRSAWVADQAGYFRSKIGRLADSQHRMERVKVVLIAIFVAATIALIFAEDPLSSSKLIEFTASGDKKPDEPVSVKTLLIFIMGALPFLLGVWELHNNKLATKELLWQYRNQADYFGAAEREMEAFDETGGRRDIIARLGRKSLAEGYQWAMYRFHREHEPPVAG
ncbi:MAG: hypothetical protein ACR2N5_05610 [Solirubrobacterales bacterium]